MNSRSLFIGHITIRIFTKEPSYVELELVFKAVGILFKKDIEQEDKNLTLH